MERRVAEVIEILERTPETLRAMLAGLGTHWLEADEGPDTYSPLDVLGHLIYGEETDWLPRARLILESGERVPFTPFDRLGFVAKYRGRSMAELLDRFAALRRENLEALRALNLSAADLERTGTHPVFGRVTLDQLIAAWAVHDLTHLAQIVRVMTKRYGAAVGPWREFMGVLRR
jgi:hypothetical protein